MEGMLLIRSRNREDKGPRAGHREAQPARMLALGVFLCAALCLAVGFSRSPRLYPVDYGNYETILRQCGLEWTQEDLAKGDLQYIRPVTEFAWARFAWSDLFTPNAGGSVVYLVSLVRLFFRPLGLPFSVDALAAVSALLLCAAVALMALGMRRLFPRVWYIPAALFCFMAMDGNFCAIFRSLYPQGPAIVFSALFAAFSLYAFSLPKEKRPKWLGWAVLLSVLTLKAFTGLIVFLPLCLAVDIALAISCYGYLKKRLDVAAALLLILASGLGSAVVQGGQDPDYYSNAAVYESVFNTMLPAAANQEGALRELGLDGSYLPDIGKSYYEPEEAYAHNPRDAQEAEKLFAGLTPARVAGVYLKNSSVLEKAIAGIPVSLRNGFENGRNRELEVQQSGYSASRTEGGAMAFLWRLLPHSYGLFFLCQVFFFLLGLILCVCRTRLRWLFLSLYSLCAALYLPFSVIHNGYGQCQQYMLIETLLHAVLAAQWLCLMIWLAPRFAQWVTRYTLDPFRVPAVAPLPCARETGVGKARAFFSRWADDLAGTRNRIVLATAVAACGLLMITFLPKAHPVSVNNGDFGRMMAQMGLTWPGDIFYDSAAQMGRKAIEEYPYLRPFEPLRLTPLQPTYSLYLFVSLSRLFTQPFGLPLSTLLLAWMMGLISVLCVVSLARDLYPILGKWTLLLSAALCAMLFSETYLVWYNSLYGESCVLAGLLMTLACAVHLGVTREIKGWKKYLWLLGLALSLYVLCCAKSQMLLAVPGAAALLIVFFAYHRPYRYDLQAVHGAVCLALCAALALASVGVYRSDRNEDSVSQRHTMWQAYFYGIFMIADDPIAEMERLGVDTAMAPDIGKYVSFTEDAGYVYAPLSPEAQTAFYDHVSMGTIVKWYLTHPAKLVYMLNHAAREAKSLYTGFRVYLDQDYSNLDHEEVNGRNLWPGWRADLAPGSFLGYLIQYGALLGFLIWRMVKKGTSAQVRALSAVPLFLIVTGALQFPLSVLGNGFADNQKQLFCFSLCHDFLLAGVIVWGLKYLNGAALRLPEKKIGAWLSIIPRWLNSK